jgi:hypothetical protein
MMLTLLRLAAQVPAQRNRTLISRVSPKCEVPCLSLSSQSDSRAGSDGAMEGVTPGRTGVYASKAVDRYTGVIWKSVKVFEINYALASTHHLIGLLRMLDTRS